MRTSFATPRRRRHERVGKGPLLGSALVHTVAILLAWWTSALDAEIPEFVVYEIELVSPPPAVLGDATPPPPEPLVIETPVEPAPEPQEETPQPLIDEELPIEPEPQPEEVATPPESELDPVVAAGPDPDTEADTPGEDLNVRMEGLRRDYPEYYNNIIRQIQRCFRWRGSADLSATIYFTIHRDGTVSGIDVLESSNHPPFDIEAEGAAECAGSPGRLGPLPEDLPFDQLPIVFRFDPKSRSVGGNRHEESIGQKELTT